MSQHESSQAQLSGTKPEDTFYEADDTGLTYAGRLDRSEEEACTTPRKHSESSQSHLAASCSFSEDTGQADDNQISPASVLPEPARTPLKVLLAQSHSLQSQLDSPSSQHDDFEKLRQQHAQLLAYNHILVEENNHRLMDHADLMSELMTAQQKAYQAERASATAVANAAQLQKEVLRLSNQLDALREASEAQSSVVQSQQEDLVSLEQQLGQQQQSSMDQIEKKGWEAADWKAKALENDGHLAAANAQIADQSKVIAMQQQKYARDVKKLSVQLMRHSAATGIQSFSPIDCVEDAG